ncbi:MAG: hypothetical protein ACI814_001359, partial [Mariniblastus sp.]
DAVGGGKKLKVFDDFHIIVDAKKVRHVADQPPDFLGLTVDRMIANVGFAPRRFGKRRDDSHRGGFAGAVGANEPKQVPLLEIEFDAFDRVEFTKFLGEVFSLDHQLFSLSCFLKINGKNHADDRGCIVVLLGNVFAIENHCGCLLVDFRDQDRPFQIPIIGHVD